MYRKLTLIVIITSLISLGTANSLNSVEFEELPSAWETGKDLEFSVEASGTSIDRMIFQSRYPGEIIFDTRGETFCQNQDTCTWDFDHTENSEGTWEYRFRAYAGEDRKNSDKYRQVTYFDSLDYSVLWVERPPETAQRGKSIKISVRASDDASRFDTEGILKLQYKNENGNWKSFDTSDCSLSSGAETCSNQGTTSLDDEKVNNNKAQFRGLIEFKGNVISTTEQASVSVRRPKNVDRVVIRNLPSTHPEQTNLDFYGEASGSNLDEMELRWRGIDAIQWNSIDSTDCSGEYCELSKDNYKHPRPQMVEIQAVGRAGEQQKEDTEVIEFTKKDTGEVTNIDLDNLPDSSDIDDDIEITGDASGTDLDRIILQIRDPDGEFERETSQDCSNNDECEFSYDYNHDYPEEVDFRLRAEAGEDGENSDIQMVEFFESNDVNNVDIEDLPHEWQINEELEIDASADGDNLDKLVVQQSDRDEDDWIKVQEHNCEGRDNCDFTAGYTADSKQKKDFRVKVFVDSGQIDYSGKEEVDFVDSSDSIDSVRIDDLSHEYSVDVGLEINGEAQGSKLDRLEIQGKNKGESDWSKIVDENCGDGNSCTISGVYTASDVEVKQFRVKAFIEGDQKASDLEEVSFIEDPDTIESVSIGDLPSSYPVINPLDITGESLGVNLNKLIIQEENPDGGWNKLLQQDCNKENSCSVEGSYTAENEENKNFRVKAFTDDETEISGKRNVEFFIPEDDINSVDLYDLPVRHPANVELEVNGEASGESLTVIILEKKENDVWNSLKTKDCEGKDQCSIKSVFLASQQGDVSFRIRAKTADNELTSDSRKISFYRPKKIDSVSINELPSNFEVGQIFKIQGDASGKNLDEIKILTRDIDDISYDKVSSKTCTGDTCSLNVEYLSTDSGSKEFVVRASAGSEDKFSGKEVIEFRSVQEPEVNSVSIDDLPSKYSLNQELEVKGEASGTELDDIKVQYRSDSGFQDIGSKSCSGSSCSITEIFSTGEEESVDFRIKAFARDDEQFSDIETVSFEAEPDPVVEAVEIINLPSTHPVGNPLMLNAEASGIDLDSIELQRRNQGTEDWSQLDSGTCSGEICSLSSEVIEDTENTLEFRASASAGDSNLNSSTETVEFVQEQDEPEPGISNVELDELPSRYETGKILEINATTSGTEIQSLRILERPVNGIQWSEVDSVDCSGSSCSLDTEYIQSSEKVIEFVAEASVQDSIQRSGKEVIVFHSLEDTQDGGDGDGDEDPEDAELDIEVEDMEGNELENVRIEAENGDNKVRYTNSNGRASFDLEAGNYDLEASKEGFRTEMRDLDLDSGQQEELEFRLREEGFGVRVSSIKSKNSVCEGDDLEVNTVLSNIRESSQSIAVYVEGPGESRTRTLDIEGGDVAELEFVLENIEGTGEKQITVFAENDGKSSQSKNIELEDCDQEGEINRDIPTGITASVSPKTVLAGETFRIKGDIQNVRTSRQVDILEGNEVRLNVPSSSNGNYQAFLQTNNIGTTEITVRTKGDVSATRTVRVLPNSHVNPINAPEIVIEGQEFNVCAQVESEVKPRVVFEKNGKVLDTKDEKGEVCFTQIASNLGDNTYTIRALTSGSGSSVSRNIKVLEVGNEIKSFPRTITSVETEPGIVKVDLYNQDTEVSKFSIEAQGLDSKEISQTSNQIVLAPGERDVIYFYVNPSDPGRNNLELEILKNGKLLESRSIGVISAERNKRKKSFFERISLF